MLRIWSAFIVVSYSLNLAIFTPRSSLRSSIELVLSFHQVTADTEHSITDNSAEQWPREQRREIAVAFREQTKAR